MNLKSRVVEGLMNITDGIMFHTMCIHFSRLRRSIRVHYFKLTKQ